jgi:phage tail-like protein
MARTIVAVCALAVLVSANASAAASQSVRVEFDNASYVFQQCAFQSETQVIEVRNGNGTVTRTAGLTKYSNVVCSRPLNTDKTFWQWRKQIEQGTLNRKKVVLVFLDPSKKSEELARFTVFGAWPAVARITKINAPNLQGAGNDVEMEEIELAHEGLQRE